MKQNNFLFKTALLLVALVGGVSSSWADNVSIPQDMGSYILIGNASTNPKTTATGVTLTGCQVDGSAESSYTVGSTNGSTVRIEFALTAEAGNYLFSFKSGAQDASTVSLSLTNSSSVVVWSKASESIEDTDSWSLTKSHDFVIGDLTAGTYTMTITGVSKTGSYYGNFGNFCFHKSTQYASNWNNTDYINFSDAVSSGNSLSGTYINNLTVGSYVDFYTYAPKAGNNYYISSQFGYGKTDGSNNFTVTITDVSTSTTELNAQSYTINKGDDIYWVNSNLQKGWKKVRIAFPNTIYNSDNEHTMRCQGFRFGVYDSLPLTGTATLNLNQSGVTFNDCKYEDGSSNIGYVKNGGYADGYYVYSSEPAYYNLSANIPWFSHAGTFTMTITDVATSTAEATVTSSSITATDAVTLKIDNQITAGLKRIRFDFAGEGSDYLFNLNNVSFYKRSLNENYNYTPVAATGVDVVLTRSIPADKWATIVLPFDMTSSQITSAFGANVQVAELTDESTAEVLKFNTVTAMNANQPYAIKVASGDGYSGSVTISGVNIEEPDPNPTQSLTSWNFVGNYSSDATIPLGSYYFKDNELHKATNEHSKIKGFRGYFTPKGGGSAPTLNFVVDGETTSLREISNEELGIRNYDYYNLNGQRVAQPSKGIYIKNGKKYVIK